MYINVKLESHYLFYGLHIVHQKTLWNTGMLAVLREMCNTVKPRRMDMHTCHPMNAIWCDVNVITYRKH